MSFNIYTYYFQLQNFPSCLSFCHHCEIKNNIVSNNVLFYLVFKLLVIIITWVEIMITGNYIVYDMNA